MPFMRWEEARQLPVEGLVWRAGGRTVKVYENADAMLFAKRGNPFAARIIANSAFAGSGHPIVWIGECPHARYTQEQVDEIWLSHSAVQILVRRQCLDCGHARCDWEWGDDMRHGGPRMYEDEENFFLSLRKQKKGVNG